MQKQAIRHSTATRTLSVPDLIERAEQWRTARLIRAGQEWSKYGLGPVQTGRAVVISPARWDKAAGCFASEHYALDLVAGKCSCGDQLHIDELERDLRRAGLDWDTVGGQVQCKHFPILVLLRQAAPAPAPAAPAPSGYRKSWGEIVAEAEAAARAPYAWA